MNEQDVMKALERMAEAVSNQSEDNLFWDILALLREKDADIKMLTEQNLALGEVILKKDTEIERLREIIVKGDYSSYTARLATETWHRNNSEFIHRLEVEIERLKEHVQEGIDLGRKIPEMLTIAQAEAINEFAERLYPLYKVLCVDEGDWRNEVDKIAKKMKEG